MVLLILAGIWAAVLIPPILRARAESSPADSIVDFRRQLRVLQRTRPTRAAGPSLGTPVDPRVDPRVGPSRYVEAAAPPRPSRHSRMGQSQPPVGRPATRRSVPRSASPAQAPASRTWASRPPAKRARTMRRRRDVLFTLLMGMGTTFVLAMVLSAPALWMLHLVMDGLFVAFLAMLMRMRAIAAEKEMKLRILPQPHVPPQPAPVVLMRRSATN